MSKTMDQARAVLNHLTAWMREEIQGQGERVQTLRRLRDSMSKKDPENCEAILEEVASQEQASRDREKRCQGIFQALGKHWQVSPGVLNLRSIAERAGEDGERILELRSELQEKLNQVQEEGKQVSATARVHRAVILDVLNTLFDQKVGDPLEQQGRLLDAEA